MRQVSEQVILIHGLAETPLTMGRLEIALRLASYNVANVTYPSTLYPAESLLERYIAPLLEQFGRASKVHFVTHSLGGVLLHAALSKARPSNLGRVAMTAPGLRGSAVLEAYRHNWLFRMMFGPAAWQSGTKEDGFAYHLPKTADYPLGIVAGCLPSDPLSVLISPMPHDGKIRVEDTKLAGMADHIVLPLGHDNLAQDPLAVFQVLNFLKRGHFLHLTEEAAKSAA